MTIHMTTDILISQLQNNVLFREAENIKINYTPHSDVKQHL